MKKKTLLCAIFMVVCSAITACNDKDVTEATNVTASADKKFESVAENTEKKIELPEGKEVITETAKFEKPKESQEYQFETDYQFYMRQSQCGVKTSKGYVVNQERMELFDTESKVYTYMCSLPQCAHIGIRCEAYAPTFFGSGYSNGCIYNVMLDEGGDYAQFDLKKITEDGKEKNLVKNIIRVETDMKNPLENCAIDYICHRGYLYYIYNIGTSEDESEFYNNYSNCLYRMPLDGSSEPEFLMAMNHGFCLGLENLCAYGSYVYFCMCDLNGYGEIYRYNIENDKIEKMNIGIIAEETFTVLDGCIIYKKKYYDKILYKYNPLDDTETVFADFTEYAQGDSWDVNRDSKYIFVYHTNDDTKEAYFLYLNHDGTYAGKMVVNTAYDEHIWYGNVIGGDEYFLYKLMETGELMYAEKAQLKTDEVTYLTKAN